jgi:hypothetical protein
MQVQARSRYTPSIQVRRLAWLLACVLIGGVVGMVGTWLSGNTTWYVAIPAVIAIGWFVHADPTQCVAPSRERVQLPADWRAGSFAATEEPGEASPGSSVKPMA